MLHLISFLGILAFAAIAWCCSENRSKVSWRTVAWSLGLQLFLGALVFWAPGSRTLFLWANDAVDKMLTVAMKGAEFVFGPLATGMSQDGKTPIGFILAFQVLPIAVFFSALVAGLYQLKLIQPVVRVFAKLFHRTLGISGAEALSSAANIFVGVESALVIKPYLERMTRSEFLVVLVTGMATVASTVLGLYVSFFQRSGVFPTMAGHLIAASVIAIPAAVVISKILVPETGNPETMGTIPVDAVAVEGSLMGAIMQGAMDGVKLAVGIAAGLIALLGLVALVDLGLASVCGWFGAAPLTLTWLSGKLFYPLAALLGVPTADIGAAAELLGTRLIQTEVPAYLRLAELARTGAVSPRTVLIVSYALCGFAHVASVAIFVGGTAALCPSRRDDLARLGPRALFAATLATLMTAAVAGVFSTGEL